MNKIDMVFSQKFRTLLYNYIITALFYKPFSKKAGNMFIVIHPIWITMKYITVGNNVVIRNNARIEGLSIYQGVKFTPEINIGDEVKIQQNLHLTCAKKIEIGNNTAIAANVTITDIDHEYEDINTPPEKQPLKVTPVIIGANCKINNNVVILPGTILGKHVIVGSNSVVKGNFPDFSVIAGVPVRIIKRYNVTTKKWEKTDKTGNFFDNVNN